MGARQSKSLPKPNADQVLNNLPSPFDSLPLHLLAKIFAQITDVGSKMRLSRVCHRFRSCIELEESWRLNTALKSQELKSPEAVLAFMKRVPRVKSLDLDLDGWMPPQVLEHAAKLRFSRLRVSCGPIADLGALVFLEQCVQYFGPSLTHLRVEFLDSESAVTVLLNLMAKCSALEDVYYVSILPVPSQEILTSLEGKPLKKLEINSWHPTEDHSMTTLMNSVPGHSLHTMDALCLRFANPLQFCRQLHPSAARALKKICLSVKTAQDQTIFEFVREMPRLLPNVEQVSIICHLRHIPMACFGCMQAFKHILDSAEHRSQPLSVGFDGRSLSDHELWCGKMMAGWFEAFTAEFGSTNDYGVQFHTGSPWKQTISKGQATVTLICYI